MLTASTMEAAVTIRMTPLPVLPTARPARRVLLLAALVLVAGAGCGGDSATDEGPGNEPPPDNSPRLQTIVVTSVEARDSMRAGQSLQLTAAGRDQNGQPYALGAVTWSSSDDAVATVNAATGQVSARANGQVTVKAASAGKEGTFRVTVWCKVHAAGGITSSQTWTAAEDPHCVTGSIQVDGANTVLTIEAGSEVYFARNAGIWLGGGTGGRLRAVGTASAPIRMLADTSAPVAGFWDGVALNDYSDGSELAFVTLSHCGGQIGDVGAACLSLNRTDPVLRSLTIANSAGYGVHADAGGAFGAGSDVLSITGSGKFPIHIEANRVGSLPAATLTGNSRDAIEVIAGVNEGTIQKSQTWRNAQVPYVIRGGQLFVHGPEGAPAMLTLLAGTELRFEREAFMHISHGSLVAQGTATAPVRFTAETAGIPERWAGMTMGAAAASSGALTYVVIESCGTGPVPAACLEISDEARPVLKNLTVRNSSGYGIRMLDTGAFGSGSADVSVSGTTEYPLSIAANSAGTIPTGSFAGGPLSAIEVDIFCCNNSVVTTSQTWPHRGVPYIMNGLQLFITGPNAPVLTLAPGAELRFPEDAGVIVGSEAFHPGALVARGTATAPIRFRSIAATPGSWAGLDFWDLSGGSALDYVIVEHAGAYGIPWSGNVNVYGDAPGAFITNSTLRASGACGVWTDRDVTTRYDDASLKNTFSGNAGADQCSPATAMGRVRRR